MSESLVAQPPVTAPVESRVRAAADCQSMADVREQVDRIDRLLVSLLAERQSMMDAAARIKPHRAAVRDEARIRDVLDKVLARASVEGLSPAIAEPVWRTLMDRCIAYEFVVFDRLRGGGGAGV